MTIPNFDTYLHRLRERVTEPREDATICDNCRAGLTETDQELGFCTQCKSSIESDEEDLHDFNGWETGLYD